MNVSQIFDLSLWGNPLQRWLIAAGIVVTITLVARLLRGAGVTRLREVTRRTATSLDDVLVQVVEGTSMICVAIAATYLGSLVLALDQPARERVAQLVSVALVVQLGLYAQRAVTASVARWAGDEPQRETSAKAIDFSARLVVWAVMVVLVLSNLGVEVTALVAGLGVGGVAAALAVQNVLGDVISSFSIYLDRPFDLGDFIVVGDYAGNVVAIHWRTTRLRSVSGEEIIIANSDLAKSRVRNYRRMEERRIAFDLGIEYNLPVDKVRAVVGLIRESVEQATNTRFDRCHFKRYGDSALLFETVYWITSPDYATYMDSQHQVLLGIYERFEDHDIPFAFPSHTIHLRQDGELQVGAAPISGPRSRAER